MTERRLGRKAPEGKVFHAFIATPAYDGKVDSDYAQALAEASYCAPLYACKVTQSVMGNGAFIDLARNVFVKMFLEREEMRDCTHLFFIDSDLKFEARAFIGLLKADLPVCAGVYRRRQEPEDYPVKFSSHPEQGGLWFDDEGWLLCDRVPTGFLCIRRDVVEAMAKDAIQMNIAGQNGPVPRLFYTYLDEKNAFVGEDYAFCDDYRKKYGKPIPVWPNFDFVHGGFKGNLSEFIERKVKEEEAKTQSTAA
jgi:hypothetical protein